MFFFFLFFLIKTNCKNLHTCQLTRLDKFSTINRYSVRNGGPYRDEDLEFLDLFCIRMSRYFAKVNIHKMLKNY